MIYIAAGVLLLFVLAGAGRKARQREMVASLRRNFVVEAKRLLAVTPGFAASLSDAELVRLFDEIYAEHLRRFGARDFADLLRKGESADAASISAQICVDAAKRLCSAHQDCDAHLVGRALSDALTLAGPDMYAEMAPNR